ncbi:hypothetical protein GCM10011578_014380 [Streptomyces fuscichromogenes]|uniref:Uncharacterized protein n=1 Tax=Streptomyces fuscichromogenes TaxID=1324013 RepID=A0A917UJX9_9ACTN|nr:hypothetical protein GCM10011578_014380 [Streptomyces fuscichromogenes]
MGGGVGGVEGGRAQAERGECLLTGSAGRRDGSVGGHKLSFVFGISDKVRGSGQRKDLVVRRPRRGQGTPRPAYD